MKKVLFTGAGIAIITPFDENNKVDFQKLEQIIEYQIENGTDALIVCGTTGEKSTLLHEEHVGVIRHAVACTAGRIPVIAGTGSNDTEYTVRLSNEAESCGADGLLLVTPYYNKTSQEGLIRHYRFITQRVSAPVILYNVPSRTGMTIEPQTYLELSKIPNIVGTKEATGDISHIAATMALCGDDLAVYSGNDDQITPIMSLGGKGVISVLSHVAPRVAHDIAASYLDGNVSQSARLQLEWLDVCKALFADVNPIPVKEAMNMMGWQVGACRMPLAPMSSGKREILRKALAAHGLI